MLKTIMYSSNQSYVQKPSAPAIGIPSTAHPPPEQYYSYNDANINQPPAHFPATAPAAQGFWSSGLCGCFSDVSNCKFSLCNDSYALFSLYIHRFRGSISLKY